MFKPYLQAVLYALHIRWRHLIGEVQCLVDKGPIHNILDIVEPSPQKCHLNIICVLIPLGFLIDVCSEKMRSCGSSQGSKIRAVRILLPATISGIYTGIERH